MGITAVLLVSPLGSYGYILEVTYNGTGTQYQVPIGGLAQCLLTHDLPYYQNFTLPNLGDDNFAFVMSAGFTYNSMYIIIVMIFFKL